MLAHFVLVAFLQASSPSVTAPVSPPETEVDKPPELICKVVKMTGSNIRKKRVCMTRAEMTAESERAKDTVRSIERSGSIFQPSVPGGSG
ncbi:MAG: hypothetical protein ABMA14_12300 [Hyphomonadaceae bacterium]